MTNGNFTFNLPVICGFDTGFTKNNDYVKICEIANANIGGTITINVERYNSLDNPNVKSTSLKYELHNDDTNTEEAYFGTITNLSRFRLELIEADNNFLKEFNYSDFVIIKDVNGTSYFALKSNNVIIKKRLPASFNFQIGDNFYNEYIANALIDVAFNVSVAQSEVSEVLSATYHNNQIENFYAFGPKCARIAKGVKRGIIKLYLTITNNITSNASKRIPSISITIVNKDDIRLILHNAPYSLIAQRIKFYKVINEDNSIDLYFSALSSTVKYDLTTIEYSDFPTFIEYFDSLPENASNISEDIEAGITDYRPILHIYDTGFVYFDTTINKPIWWNGTSWVDATGTTV